MVDIRDHGGSFGGGKRGYVAGDAISSLYVQEDVSLAWNFSHYDITTGAGTGNLGDLDVDTRGDIYLGGSHGQVFKLAIDGSVVWEFKHPTLASTFRMIVHHEGFTYAGYDLYEQSVLIKLNAQGALVWTKDLGDGLSGVGVNIDGNIFCTFEYTPLVVLDPNGNVIATLTNVPRGFAISRHGTDLMVVAGQGDVYIINSNLALVTSRREYFLYISHVDIDKNGNTYHSGVDRFWKTSSNGTMIWTSTDPVNSFMLPDKSIDVLYSQHSGSRYVRRITNPDNYVNRQYFSSSSFIRASKHGYIYRASSGFLSAYNDKYKIN